MSGITADKDSLGGWLARASLAVALAAILYHALSVWFTLNGAMQHYTMHAALVLVLGALVEIQGALRHAKSRRRRWRVILLVALIACTILSTPYLYVMAEPLELSQPFLQPHELWIGLLLVTAVLALTWITWGAALGIVCLVAALYFALGQYVPAIAVGLSQPFEVVISYLAGMGGPRGVYTYLPLSADTIFLLLVYGALMAPVLVLDMFTELGKAIGNLFRGGVAYSCIIASTLVGMVTGQTVSTIVLTGTMTIPTMVRRGFTKEEAGAIETLAANGSQIIPPVMGLGAFLMAVILGIPYTHVATAAVLPALLYMIAVTIAVFTTIQASPAIPYQRESVDWGKVLWVLPAFLPSFGLLIAMLYMQFTAGFAALIASVILLGGSFVRPARHRPRFGAVLLGLREGAVAGAQLGVILAGIGVIVQMLVTTGAGMGLSRLMIDIAGDSVELALLIGMVIALIIGMGLPTPAAYSLCAIVMIPSLIDVGVPPLVAHFYGFYFAVFSSITPPVAVGILMAVRISGGSFSGTVVESLKIGGVCLLLPFFMVAYPNLLDFPDIAWDTVVASLLLCLSTLMLAAAIYGALRQRLGWVERGVLMAGPLVTLVYYSTRVDALAFVPPLVFIGLVVWRRWRGRRPRLTASAASGD